MQIEVTVPDGRMGEWVIDSFEVSEEDAAYSRRRAAATLGREPAVPAGRYKRLMRGNALVMSNTPMEIDTHREFIRLARGNVLINGLGLGMALTAILRKPEVKSVTVIERSAEVIELVGPTFASDDRLAIICADAFTWTPPRGSRFDAVWHDIWDDITSENLPGMAELHRKYARRARWQDSGAREECKALR